MPAQRLPRSYAQQQEFPAHRRRPLNRFQMLLIWIFSIALGFCILAAVLKLALGVPNASLPAVYSVGKGVAISIDTTSMSLPYMRIKTANPYAFANFNERAQRSLSG